MGTSGGSSGGSAFPAYTGSGSPEGHQTAAVGKSYGDTTNAALYYKYTGAGNTGWICVGGWSVDDDAGAGIVGVGLATNYVAVLARATNRVYITDLAAFVGSGNGLTWNPGSAADGLQDLRLFAGTNGAFEWDWLHTGITVMPGPIITAPTNSHTATVAFGQVAVGTPRQNSTGYDLLVAGTVSVTSATAGSLNLGVGPTATPTVDPITGSLTTAALVDLAFSAVVPNGYYLSLTSSGTIALGTPVSVATPL